MKKSDYYEKFDLSDSARFEVENRETKYKLEIPISDDKLIYIAERKTPIRASTWLDYAYDLGLTDGYYNKIELAIDLLTDREREYLRLWFKGYTFKQMDEHFGYITNRGISNAKFNGNSSGHGGIIRKIKKYLDPEYTPYINKVKTSTGDYTWYLNIEKCKKYFKTKEEAIKYRYDYLMDKGKAKSKYYGGNQMLKVACIITSNAHKRVFESFKLRPDLEQLVITTCDGDWSAFKLPINKCPNIQEAITRFQPDTVLQTTLTKYKLPPNCKRIFVQHGLVPDYASSLAELGEVSFKDWRGFDYITGAGLNWKSICLKLGYRPEQLIDAMPQFDLLTTNPPRRSVEPTVLFMGFEGKDRSDFQLHNEDYYKTCVTLGRLKGFQVIIKARHYFNETVTFLQKQSYCSTYLTDYENLAKNPNVMFVTSDNNHIYKHFYADVFVINGCSSAELEACALNKPLLIVKTKIGLEHDPFASIKLGAAQWIHSENLLNWAIESPHDLTIQRQALLKHHGIVLDGLHAIRIQELLLNG